MTTRDDQIVRTLRTQAWQRAKGELHSMLATFWGGDDSNFDAANEVIKKFVAAIEDYGLHE